MTVVTVWLTVVEQGLRPLCGRTGEVIAERGVHVLLDFHDGRRPWWVHTRYTAPTPEEGSTVTREQDQQRVALAIAAGEYARRHILDTAARRLTAAAGVPTDLAPSAGARRQGDGVWVPAAVVDALLERLDS